MSSIYENLEYDENMKNIQDNIMEDCDAKNKNMVNNAIKAIKKYNLEKYIRTFNENNGFMFSSDKRIIKIGCEVIDDGHSGCSFACTMRNCQYILQKQHDFINKKDDEEKVKVSETFEENTNTYSHFKS